MENRKKEFDKIKLENYKTSIESIIYNSKPNIRHKEKIVNDFKHDYWIFDNFDIYYTYDIKFKLFLVYGCDDNNNINIVRLEDKKLIKSLKGHEDIVDIVKHFYNEINNKNYLLSADYNKLVIVWDLNKYIPIHKINTYYTKYIYSFTILFPKNYVITSTEGNENDLDTTNIYSLIDGHIIRNIKQTSKFETLYLLIWVYNNHYYLIELCFDNILIYDLSNGKLFKALTSEFNRPSYFYTGYISYDNKYLYTCTIKGIIAIWNLYDGTLVFNTRIKNLNLLEITLWSTEIKKKKNISNDKEEEQKITNYILFSNKTHKGFLCINISFDRVIKRKECKEYDTNFNYHVVSFYGKGKDIKCIKKIIHPIYGECLLTSGNDRNIDLWINNNGF